MSIRVTSKAGIGGEGGVGSEDSKDGGGSEDGEDGDGEGTS